MSPTAPDAPLVEDVPIAVYEADAINHLPANEVAAALRASNIPFQRDLSGNFVLTPEGKPTMSLREAVRAGVFRVARY